MVRIEDGCCSCGRCIGAACNIKEARVLYCDWCESEAEKLHRLNPCMGEEELCRGCLDHLIDRSGLTYQELVTATIR